MSDRPTGPDPVQIGRYRILGVLGEGGMARVYRAFDPELKREVALKLPHAAAMKRWSREATAVARLAHPNIIAVYDIGESDGRPYLAMELIEGRQLARGWLQWPLRRRIETLHRVAQAVEYAHSRGVVHRDLKPENVMIDDRGSLKVVDFGLARVSGERSVTMTGALLGSPAYMAPEQVQGDHAGAPSDIYALGVMIYEALTGEVPFLGANARVIYDKILTEDPVRPSARAPGVPTDLETVALKAISKRPDRRYATARELREDLERWLHGEAVAARPSTFLETVGRRLKRNRIPVAIGLILAIAAGVSATAVLSGAANSARIAQAAALANEASLAYAAGDIPAARAKAELALRIVPDQTVARYWLARVKLREYRTLRGLPEAYVTTGLTVVSAPPAETPAQKALREEIVAAFRDTQGRVLAEGVVAMVSGAYDEARTYFATAAGETSPSAWEARLLEAQCLYYLGRFPEAETRLKPLLGLDPRSVDPTWGRLCVARALQESQSGRDGGEWFSLAESAGLRLEEAGLASEGKALRARAMVEAAAVERSLGRDPQPRIDRALSLLSGASRAEEWLVLGDALRLRYEHGAHTGRIDPRRPEELGAVEEAYGRAIAVNPDYERAHVRLGDARRLAVQLAISTGRPPQRFVDGARESFLKAQALSPHDPEAAMGAAWAEARQAAGDESDPRAVEQAFRRHESVLQDLAARHPSFVPIRYHLAKIRSDFAWFARGRGLEWTLNCEEALAELDRALAIAPRYVEAHKLRGDVLLEMGVRGLDAKQDPARLFQLGLDSYNRGLEINPSNFQLHAARAAGYRYVARFAPSMMPADQALREGLKSADEAVRLNSAWGHTYVVRAYLWRDLGQIGGLEPSAAREAFRNAIRDLDAGIRLNPRDVDAHRVKAMALQFAASYAAAAGDDPLPGLEEAVAACRRAMEIDPEYAGRDAGIHLALTSVNYDRAAFLERAGRDPATALQESIEAASKGLLVNPKNLDLIRGRVRAAVALAVRISNGGGDPRPALKLAEDDLTRGLGFYPDHPRTGMLFLERARVKAMGGRVAEALADYQEAVRKDPSLTELARQEAAKLR